MSKSAQVFSTYNTIVYYGGNLLFPILLLFLIYVWWSIAISRRLDTRRFDEWAVARGKVEGRETESGVDPDFRAFVENLHLDKYSRQINMLACYLCVFPVMGFLGTLLGAAKISIGTSTGYDFLHEIMRVGIIESIFTTVAGVICFIIAFFIYRYLIHKYNTMTDRLNKFVSQN